MIKIYEDVKKPALNNKRCGAVIEYKDCKISYTEATPFPEIVVFFPDGKAYPPQFNASGEGLKQAIEVIDIWAVTKELNDMKVFKHG